MGRPLTSIQKNVKKAGANIPTHVLTMMKRLHPTVEILWANQVKRWALVQTLRGNSQLIRFLDRRGRYLHPNLVNTVYYLNSIHPAKLRSKYAQERFLKALDTSSIAERVARSSALRIADGSKEMFKLMTGKRTFSMRP